MWFHRAAACPAWSRGCSAPPRSPTSSNSSDPSVRYRKTCGGNSTIEPGWHLPRERKQEVSRSPSGTGSSPFLGGQGFASVGISTWGREADRLPLGPTAARKNGDQFVTSSATENH